MAVAGGRAFASRRLAIGACAAGALLAGVPAGAEGRAACAATPDGNRAVVLDFYRMGLVGLQPRRAFELYVAPDFVEHKPDVGAGTREAAAAYLEALIRSLPAPRWEVLRTVAEGDLVFLHARFTPARGAAPYAVADLFRVKDCRIVEHWDVVAGPPETQNNPNSRF